MTREFGLIGYPLEHSFSPLYFREKFKRMGIDARYRPFELRFIQDFPNLLTGFPTLEGLNVTIPHKTAIINFLDEVDIVAEKLGAVNCIKIKDGKTYGYNTDIIGFRESLIPLLKPHHDKALILGNGGAAKAVKHVLDELFIPYLTVVRRGDGDIKYTSLDPEIIFQHTIIINTTPLGMSPNIEGMPPIPYKFITERHLLYDLVYNPQKTQFLKQGEEHGAAVKSGLEMLFTQAEAGWDIWNSGH